MSRIPRILPLAGVAIVGVMAINAIAGAKDLPGLFSSAQAFAEGVAAKAKGEEGKPAAAKDAKAEPVKLAAASPLPPRDAPAAAQSSLPGACTPNDAAIGREAGLSPEQMRLLEGLQARRGQLDDREKAMEMQLSLLAATEGKLDQRIATLNGLKAEITALLNQADEKQKAETARMVGVYTTMAQQKPKEAAKQLTIMDDKVRLPIAAGLSNRTLATILSNMTPADATKLNEALVHRYENQKSLDAGRAALANPQASAAAAPPAAGAKPQQLAAAQPAKAASATPPAAAKPAAAPAPAAAAPADPAKPAAAPKPKPRKPAAKPAAKKDDPADAAAPMKTDPAAEKAQAG